MTYQPKLEVQKYLETHSIDDLEREHGVFTRLSTHGRKLTLNYDQILAKPGNIVEECRGLVIRLANWRILSEDPGWKTKVLGPTHVLAYPLQRFYNYGDPACAAVNLSDPNLRIEEKVDGTLCIVYYDEHLKSWCVGTRSVPDADLPISNMSLVLDESITFRGLFERTIREQFDVTFDVWTGTLDKEHTYCFELTTPYNKVVVKHEASRVTLLMKRSLRTFLEIPLPVEGYLPFGALSTVPVVKRYPIMTIDDIVKFVNERDHNSHEGLVLIDSHLRRSKVKNPKYMLASRAKDAIMASRREALRCILNGSIDDLLPLVGVEEQKVVEDMRTALTAYMWHMEGLWQTWKDAPDRKTFASQVTLSREISKPFFERWENRTPNINSWFQRMAIDQKLSIGMLDAVLKRMDSFAQK